MVPLAAARTKWRGPERPDAVHVVAAPARCPARNAGARADHPPASKTPPQAARASVPAALPPPHRQCWRAFASMAPAIASLANATADALLARLQAPRRQTTTGPTTAVRRCATPPTRRAPPTRRMRRSASARVATAGRARISAMSAALAASGQASYPMNQRHNLSSSQSSSCRKTARSASGPAPSVDPGSARTIDRVRAFRAGNASATFSAGFVRPSHSPPHRMAVRKRQRHLTQGRCRCEPHPRGGESMPCDQARRAIINFLISAIASAGFKPFGQVRAQFMMVWQRYSLNGSSRSSRRAPVSSSRESIIQR